MTRPSFHLLAILAFACRSPAAPPTNNSVSPIAGAYQTGVTLTANSCTGITVQNNPTIVSHSAGATTFTLTHAGQGYSGTLGANNAFTTAPNPISVSTTTHTLTIAGSFSASGFVADVTAVVSGSAVCQYVVHWIGTK